MKSSTPMHGAPDNAGNTKVLLITLFTDSYLVYTSTLERYIFQTPLKTIGRMDGCYHLSVPLNLLMGISLWQCCMASVTAVTFSAAEHCHPVPNYAS